LGRCCFFVAGRHPPNAIIFGSGAVEIWHMLRAGVILDIVGNIVVSLAILTLGTWVLSPG
jgi:sodium-dependent dicarboxylate transporter 2/3/5